MDCIKYQWSNGSASFLNEITANGTYSVTVTNETNGVNCTSSKTLIVDNFASAVFFDVSVSPTTCKGKNGSIVLAPTSGTPPFSYKWSNTTASIQLNNDFFYLLKSTNSTLYLAAQDSLCFKWLLDDGKGGYLPAPCFNQTNTLRYCELLSGQVAALMVHDCKNVGCTRILTKIRAIEEEGLPFSVEIFPNPANEQVNIVLNGTSGGTFRLGLYNVLGREMVSSIVTKTALKETFSLPVEGFSAGSYLLVVQGEDGKKTPFKIILQK